MSYLISELDSKAHFDFPPLSIKRLFCSKSQDYTLCKKSIACNVHIHICLSINIRILLVLRNNIACQYTHILRSTIKRLKKYLIAIKRDFKSLQCSDSHRRCILYCTSTYKNIVAPLHSSSQRKQERVQKTVRQHLKLVDNEAR